MKTLNKTINQKAVDNFLNSLDMEIPMRDHFRNCMRDAISYKWNSATVVEIMKGIEDFFKNKESK